MRGSGRLALALVLASGCGPHARAAAPGLVVEVTGPAVPVSGAVHGGCGPEDIPDQPLRAFRRADGTVVALATHWRVRLLTGPDLSHLKRECAVAFEAAGSADPAAHADRSWITGVWTPDGRTVHALVHDEYQAQRHEGACDAASYYACWYNTILAARSVDGGRSFAPARPVAVVAAAPFRQETGQGRPRGAFDPSNIVRRGSAWYATVWQVGLGGEPGRACLLRTQDLADPAAWRGFDGTGFTVTFADPYAPGGRVAEGRCARLGLFDAVVGSLTLHEGTGFYVATTLTRRGVPPRGVLAIATSPDLIHWSELRPVMDLGPASGDGRCGDETRMAYPSLIDPASPSRNFESTGANPTLFLTRIRLRGCRDTMERDLVALPVTIRPAP